MEAGERRVGHERQGELAGGAALLERSGRGIEPADCRRQGRPVDSKAGMALGNLEEARAALHAFASLGASPEAP
jgi:hypothetical protein